MNRQGVDASPEDIRKLAGALSNFKRELGDAAQKAQGALNAADWNDSRKTQFEARFRELRSKVDSFLAGDVDEMVSNLNKLASRLDDVRNVRM